MLGQCIKCLTVADDFSHECIDVATDFGIPGLYVTYARPGRHLPRLPEGGAYRQRAGVHRRAFMGWAQRHGIRHLLTEPGKPMQNGSISASTASSGTSA